MSISSILNTAKESLFAHQVGIDVTGGNIANVDTPGYSRQRADFSAVGKVDMQSNIVQTGVQVKNIERMCDRYLDNQVIEQSQNAGFSDTKSTLLARIEIIFNDTSENGLNNLLGQFWGAWDDLSANSTGQVERNNLAATADKLAAMMRTYSNNLRDVVGDIENSMVQKVSEINQCTSELSDLNSKVVFTGNDTGDANALKDGQRQILQELSGLVNIQYIENEDGTFNVMLADGSPLVEGVLRHELVVQEAPGRTASSQIVFGDNPAENLNSTITGGQLGALMQVRDEVIPSYEDRLDDLASAIIERVNAQHRAGYDAYGNVGGDFFADPGAGGASVAQNMRLSDAVTADANRIAASSTVTGNGENANSIAAIRDDFVMNGGTMTIGQGYSSLVGQIGLDSAEAQRAAEHNKLIMDNLSNQRESVSGVSIDEEMLALIRYQMGYSAAGKLCQSVQEMIDVLMNLLK